jgi:hypothetical protein
LVLGARVTLAICCALAVGGCASANRSSSGVPNGTVAFEGIEPVEPPSGWLRLMTPAGDAVLTYPPSFRPVRSDPGSVSVAVGAAPHVYVGYLNVTPRQGAEQPHGFSAFRIGRLGDEDTAVHEIAASENVAFAGAVGSCVNDEYRTRVGDNHYEEITCLVSGQRTQYVIVAAALFADWDRFAPTLRTALAAFKVS